MSVALEAMRKGSSRRAPARLFERRDGHEGHARGASELRLYARVLRQAKPFWPHIGALFLLSLLATPLALLTPLPLKIVVDSVVGEQALPGFLSGLVPTSVETSPTGLLFFATAFFVVVALLNELRNLLDSVLSAYAGERLLLDFRAGLFRHVQRLSLAYHDRKGTADASYRIQYDAASLQSLVLYGLAPLLTAAVTLVAMIYVTARIDWQLAMVALAVSPMLFTLTTLSRRPLKRGWTRTKELESSALSVIQEVLTGLRVVKAFGREEQEQARFMHQATAGMRARIRLALFEGGLGLLIGLVTAAGGAAVLFIGARHVQQGTLTLGSLVLVMAYLSQLYAPLKTLSRSIAKLQSSLAGAERAFTLLDHDPDVAERPHARPLSRARGEVEFRNVSFGYDADRPVLRDVSFAVAPGARVGIAGATGAGKTTLVSLLTRFYDPTDGAVLLDGVDLRDYKVADLRNQFGIVLQEPVLFSTSIGENIAYARPQADPADIMAAARAAGIHDFIEGLPEGYDTQVGERGMRLSGGERQRISLARAFLKDAPILILDEPTSSVDVRTETLIMEAMERLMRGRTTFMIAHRLSTLERCDVRLQLEAGELVEARRLARLLVARG